MIKINLLDSITERQLSKVTVVERTASSAISRLLVMSVVTAVLTLAVIGWDIVSTQMAKTDAEKELANQQEIAKQLESVMKEQKDLEQKIANIDARIGAIKRLRSTQAGPSAVLEALRERIANAQGAISLESVEQKGDQLTIKGYSPEENAVTQFGRSLEFSSGLFSNLGIETQRKELGGDPASPATVVNFTIRCAYTPSKASAPATQTAAGAPNGAPAPVAPAPGAPQQQAANQTPVTPGAAPQAAKN